MRFEQPLIEGTLVRRYKRFLADVVLTSGEEVTVHCANPGSMIGCSDPGSKVLVSVRDDPRRKFSHQLEIIFAGRVPVGIHTGRPSSVVAEAISQGKVPELAGYATMRREVRDARDSPVDLLLEGNGLRPCYVEIKNVTLAQEDVAMYPDAITEQGTKHMAELTDIVREGNRAMVIFLAQRSDVERFRPADHIDSEFGQALRDAVARGVEPICYRAKVTRKGIELDTRLPIEID
ncbi:MAG: sugar fermentation stimulation protein SfsA [Deltaproteobacteria bacterium RIFOXYA12_FULL_58_15]|nr:MAG: sugar fermentation stimulation protein SfsA [Deltaproteobacteria bacterium RIFOXYA12_FULL_58_15]OGR11011.1 MAG: sugar fermentation stimulation protein SfsA [Deltaproteobacteria bacterium RIFOXYB12_FULL_58_9]